MKVLQLGVGAVGEVNARVVAQEPQISGLVLADVDEARVRAVAEKLPPGKAETLVLDASDHGALVKAAKGADFVLNALATAWDIPVMEACLEAGVNYLDMGTGGPREITGTADLDEQLALDGEFAKRGLTAMVSFGIDPGVSDVFARALHDEFDNGRVAHRAGRRQRDARRLRVRLLLLARDDDRGVPAAALRVPRRPRGAQRGAVGVARVRLPGARRPSASSGTSTTKRRS